MFSKACEYAIRATIYIADQSDRGNRVSMEEVSKEIGSPEAFTAKVLQQLSKHKILDSMRGPTGGFFISGDSTAIRLSDIVFAIDGNKIYTGCGLGLPECNEQHPCPIHDEFKNVRDDLRTLLENTTITELASKFEKGTTYLKL